MTSDFTYGKNGLLNSPTAHGPPSRDAGAVTLDQAVIKWVWFSQGLINGNWEYGVRIGIRSSKIVAIQTGKAPEPGDTRSGTAVPGMLNAHSHGFQRAMAGLTEFRSTGSNTFWSWREGMYRLVETLTPDQFEAVTALAYVEMLESGFTRVGEFQYLHHDVDGKRFTQPAEMCGRTVAAAAETGIALTLLPTMYSRGGFDGRPANMAQRRFINSSDGFARLFDDARRETSRLSGVALGVAIHSLRAVTEEELTFAVSLVNDGPVHIHIAEQIGEVDECVAWYGQRPVEWLLDHAPVDCRWCLVHATHVTTTEIERIASCGAIVGLCPITEANLGDGIFPAERYRRLSGRLAIGSDSNVRIDAAGELNLLEYGQRLISQRRNVLALESGGSTGRSLFNEACKGGLTALGGNAGVLRIGADADIVALDSSVPACSHYRDDAVIDAWVFLMHREFVRDVWVGGVHVVKDFRHTARDHFEKRFAKVLQAF